MYSVDPDILIGQIGDLMTQEAFQPRSSPSSVFAKRWLLLMEMCLEKATRLPANNAIRHPSLKCRFERSSPQGQTCHLNQIYPCRCCWNEEGEAKLAVYAPLCSTQFSWGGVGALAEHLHATMQGEEAQRAKLRAAVTVETSSWGKHEKLLMSGASLHSAAGRLSHLGGIIADHE